MSVLGFTTKVARIVDGLQPDEYRWATDTRADLKNGVTGATAMAAGLLGTAAGVQSLSKGKAGRALRVRLG